ncbi:MAG: hypothetical protein BZY88_11745 [SAR202 cluster bacterium Io17-Chloro-G9]|nr:MAG: hypothetical protein BZY88_11745 [SAR202 cluster bacterium Io17-Chloro-G9]
MTNLHTYTADLHLHSRYAYATSKYLSLDSLSAWAKLKGIDLLASADFTHPAWLEELRQGLTPAVSGSGGLYRYNDVHFVLGTEVSCVYRQGDRSRRLHLLLFAPDFEAVDSINRGLAKYGRLDSDGRPTLSISARDLVSLILEANPQCLVIPAHIWTPWYGVLGSKSGFDSLEDCFRDMYTQIHAVETGLSSDPSMNWQVPEIQGKTIVSFSDAHSPAKLGREATAFQGQMSYAGLAQALAHQGVAYTVEFYPEEGKYHNSGHRKCGVSLDAEQSKRAPGRCARCGRPLTMGVKHRISELSKRGIGALAPPDKSAVPAGEGQPPFMKLLPLQEILAQSMGLGLGSKKLQAEYHRLVSELGGELRTLTQADDDELATVAGEELARLVIRARQGRVVVEPGYDGVYGKVRVMTGDETQA